MRKVYTIQRTAIKLAMLVGVMSLTVSLGFAQKATKEQKIQRRVNEAIKEYGYPVDSATGRITYKKTREVAGASKSELFKRLMQFVATQDFGRTENIKCRNNTYISTAIFDKDVIFKDDQQGRLMGNGFLHLKYQIGGTYNYVVVFKYKVSVQENSYKYEFTNFNVLEFLSAPKDRAVSSGYRTNVGGAVFSSGGGSTTFSSTAMSQEEMEEFILRGVWKNEDAGHNEFIKQLDLMLKNLKETMNGGF